MRTIHIKVLDAVHSQFLSKEDAVLLKPTLSYDNSGWRQSQYGNSKIERRGCFIDMRNRLFLTGFLPRIREFCTRKGWQVNIDSDEPMWIRHITPNLSGITFRPDQIDALNKACSLHRGCIVAPMGTGKSVLMSGILSMWPNLKWLALAHTTSLVSQLKGEFAKFGLRNVEVYTRQGFAKRRPKDYADSYDGILVDEIHQGGGGNSYNKILTNMLTPLRFCFTATLPIEEHSRLLIEGLFGPVIGELSMAEAQGLNILAEPKVKFVNVPKSPTISSLKTYRLIYEEGVVNSRTRNRLIMNEVINLTNKGLTCIVFVQEIQHLQNLMHMAAILGVSVAGVHGATDAATREAIKLALAKKSRKCVISSVVWREGINIPSLDAVIFASGLKSEVGTLQSVGRALRRTEGKTQALIVDFLDPYKYLAEHTINRLKTYNTQGWL